MESSNVAPIFIDDARREPEITETEAPPAKKSKPRLTDEQRLQAMVDAKSKLIDRLEQHRRDALAKADELDRQLALEHPKLAGLRRALGEIVPTTPEGGAQ